MPFNVRVGGRRSAAAGGARRACCPAPRSSPCSRSTSGARWVGLGWMAFGVLLYVYYRLSEDKPLLKRITVPEEVLTRKRAEAEYGSILVPILGTPLDDDIVQTAGRLAAEEDDELGEGGAVIEALWVFEVPMALPLDAPRARRRAQARAQGAGAREGGRRGVRGRRGGDRGRARAPGGRGDRARGQAPRRGGDRARRRGADPHARRRAVRRQAGPARHVRGGDDALRGQQGAVPRAADRAARRRAPDPDASGRRAGRGPGRTCAGPADR